MESVKTTIPANAAGIWSEVTKKAIVLRRIFENDFQKEGTLTAELEQEVDTVSYYPSKKVTSNKQDGLFDTADFGFKPNVYPSTETRVAWIPVPATATEDVVRARIDAMYKAGATIYKELSNEPILDDNQKSAIDRGLRSMDQFADSQVCKYPVGHEREGMLILNNGLPMYRRVFFSATPKDDVDTRGNGKVYYSPDIRAAIEGAAVAFVGQTI